jgi:hypothetical protein
MIVRRESTHRMADAHGNLKLIGENEHSMHELNEGH